MRLDTYGNDIGSVTIEPSELKVTVGSRYKFDIIYTSGPEGVQTGGSLRIKLPGINLRGNDKGPVRCSNPNVTWKCSDRLESVNGKNGHEFFTAEYLFVTITEGVLSEGDTLTVRYGDSLPDKYTAAPIMAQNRPVEAAVDPDGTRRAPASGFYLVPDPPVIEFSADKPVKAEVFIPSYTKPGKSFRTTVCFLDRFNNIADGFTGTALLSDETGTALQSIECKAEERGVYTTEETVFTSEGIHRLTASTESLGISGRSNPTKTGNSEKQLYWGDTHCHSSISADSSAINFLINRPAADYAYARNRAALDFCMVTDHVEDQSEEDWEETRNAAHDCNEPGRFVTFSGFEATFHPSRKNGDKNVYFLEDNDPFIQEGTTEELYENLRNRESELMVIPHLHAPTNWDLHDPELERVVEVYSHWGSGFSPETVPQIVPGNKRPEESYVTYALEQGCKVGFIASADHSFGHPGDDFFWGLSSYNGGLAAVFSETLDRKGIWDGLWRRECYGTTRARILVEFEINGNTMGSETGTTGSRKIILNVYGTSGIETITIFKNNKTFKTIDGEGTLDLEFELTDGRAEKETDYYYVHILQKDGEQAWVSPIWVNKNWKSEVGNKE